MDLFHPVPLEWTRGVWFSPRADPNGGQRRRELAVKFFVLIDVFILFVIILIVLHVVVYVIVLPILEYLVFFIFQRQRTQEERERVKKPWGGRET